MLIKKIIKIALSCPFFLYFMRKVAEAALLFMLSLALTEHTKNTQYWNSDISTVKPWRHNNLKLRWHHLLNTKRNNLIAKANKCPGTHPNHCVGTVQIQLARRWPQNSFHASSLGLKRRDRQGCSDNCASESSVNKTFFFFLQGAGQRGETRQESMLTHPYHTHSRSFNQQWLSLREM